MTHVLVDYGGILAFANAQLGSTEKTRMYARLLENQDLDSWMTYELMQAAIDRVAHAQDFPTPDRPLQMTTTLMTYNLETGTTAERMHLAGAVDHFFNFKGIKADGTTALRHQTRPDGVFALQMTSCTGKPKDMVLFYEGDVHAKDSGKTAFEGCPNCHKMYQYMAQCQAKSAEMAGCAVFAAMEYATSDEIVPFICDMFRAHVFVFTAMAHYNYMLDAPRLRSNKREPTFLGSVLTLNNDVDYDFVIGINMAYKTDALQFKSTGFFDTRIRMMLTGLHQATNVDIELHDNLKFIVDTKHYQCTIGSVAIVFVAIPRAPTDALRGRSAGFLYPMHMQEIITWGGDDAELPKDCNAATDLLSVDMNNNNNFRFKKKMMLNTSVLTFGGAVGNTALDCTTGFFYIAIPLAYYTTQQFSFINDRLDYSYCVSKKKFKDLLEIFKETMKTTKTSKASVLMFKENKKSLFHELCASTHIETEKVASDFKLFLCEACRWKDEDVNQESSPDIFFRTLGIYSLQNAIDFAFEVKQTQNNTYTAMLSSYPVGAQMTIKQCMKKLTENEAYAYIQRDGLDTAMSALTLTAQNNDDDDDAPDPVLEMWKNFEKLVGDCFAVSDWRVDFLPNTDEAERDRLLALSNDQSLLRTVLIHSYKRTLLTWIKTTSLSDLAVEPTRDDYQAFLSGGKFRRRMGSITTATGADLNFIKLQYAVEMPRFITLYRVTIDSTEMNLKPEHVAREFRLTYRDIAEQLRRDIEQIKTINDISEVHVLEDGFFMKFTRVTSIFSSDYSKNIMATFTSAASTVGKTIFDRFFPAISTVTQPALI
jgi:hypothetical protein